MQTIPPYGSLPTGDSIYRKISLRLLPLLFLMYVVAYLDRVNIGFARLQMNADLEFSDTVYGLGAGIFFLGYFLFEIPSNLILQRVGARIWIARILIVWGLLSMAMIWTDSPGTFYGLRFLLGVGEAGFFPGIIYYLTSWYPDRRRARTTAWFMAAVPAAGVIGGPLSGWLMTALEGLQGLRGWQWLFIAEGLPAIVLGCITLLWLDDHPEQARWLSLEDKRLLQIQCAADRKPYCPADHCVHLRDAVRSSQVWSLATVYFFLVMGTYGISFWLPQMVHDLNAGTYASTGLLTAIPYAVAVFGMIWIGSHSDRTRERRGHLVVCAAVAACGFTGCWYYGNSSLSASLIALSAATLGVSAALAIFWSLPTAILSGRAAAGGIALINSVGNLGGYFSPVALGWLRDMTQRMDYGLLLLAAALGLAAVLLYAFSAAGARAPGAEPAE